MKQVRKAVFETNSSSTHSIVMCSEEEERLFLRGELFISSNLCGRMYTKEEAIKEYERLYKKKYDESDEEEFNSLFFSGRSEDEFWDKRGDYFELERATYTTKEGTKVIARSYYIDD